MRVARTVTWFWAKVVEGWGHMYVGGKIAGP